MSSRHNRAPSLLSSTMIGIVSSLALIGVGYRASNASASTRESRGQAITAKKLPSDTPLKALTGIITRLKDRKSAEVTANYIQVIGESGEAAEVEPLVFNEGGQTYFAFTQEYIPNFRLSAARLAGRMVILTAQYPSDSTEMPLVKAHLVGGVLEAENKNHTPVGYSENEAPNSTSMPAVDINYDFS